MAAFGADGRCLMRALQEELDDPDPSDCGRCSVCAGPRYAGPLDPGARARGGAAAALAPDRAGDQEDGARRERRDAQDPRGRARRGGPRAGAARRRRLGPGRAGRAAGGRVRRRAGRRRRRGRARVARAGGVGGGRAVAARASLVPEFARAPGRGARAPVRADALERVGDRPPQREMANSAQQVANVRGAFAVARRAAARAPACSSTTSASAAGRWRWWRAAAAAWRPGGLPAGSDQRVLGTLNCGIEGAASAWRLRIAEAGDAFAGFPGPVGLVMHAMRAQTTPPLATGP